MNEPSVEPTEPTYYCYDYDTLDGYFYTLGEAVVGSTVLRTSDNAVTTSPDNLSANNDVSITAVNGDAIPSRRYLLKKALRNLPKSQQNRGIYIEFEEV